MKAIFFIFAVFLSPFFATNAMEAQTIADITKALGKGDIASLSTLMDSEVELSILEEENVYTREQAKEKLTAFFSANAPSAFSQVHQGSSKADDAEYCIGNLTTTSGAFRVYIYVAKKGNGMVLQELRFDRE